MHEATTEQASVWLTPLLLADAKQKIICSLLTPFAVTMSYIILVPVLRHLTEMSASFVFATIAKLFLECMYNQLDIQ